jgi:folate-binding protein YgfZ
MARGQQLVSDGSIAPAVTSGYMAVYNGALLIDRSAEGRFELRDRDRLDLLQRMSTNDLRGLSQGQGRSTVLTTALARIIDRLILYERGDTANGTTLVVCGVGRTATVRGWLQRHIFFQDKVQTRDVGAETCQFGLFGAKAASVAAQFVLEASKLSLHDYREFELGGASILLARTYPLVGDGFTLIAPIAARDALLTALNDMPDVTVIAPGIEADSLYDLLRIEAAVPLAGHELGEEYLPLEAGLWDSISFAKGCYTGQEIIARMESRHQLARTIAQFTLSAPVPVGTSIRRRSQPDHSIGVLTSVATRPDDTVIALGYVKMDALEDNLVVTDLPGDSVTISLLNAVGWNKTPPSIVQR